MITVMQSLLWKSVDSLTEMEIEMKCRRSVTEQRSLNEDVRCLGIGPNTSTVNVRWPIRYAHPHVMICLLTTYHMYDT
jgi:hypothetical protein